MGRRKGGLPSSSTRPSPSKKDSSSSRFGSSLRSGGNDRLSRIPEPPPSPPPMTKRSPSPALPPLSNIGTSSGLYEEPRETEPKREANGFGAGPNGVNDAARESSTQVNGAGAFSNSQIQRPSQPVQPPRTSSIPKALAVSTKSPDPVCYADAEPLLATKRRRRIQRSSTRGRPHLTSASRSRRVSARCSPRAGMYSPGLTSCSTSDNSNQQFKVDIRNAPISEEGPAAESAMASVANTLRAVSVASVSSKNPS